MATTHLPRLVRPVSSMAEATMSKHLQQLDRTLGVHGRAETPGRVATVATQQSKGKGPVVDYTGRTQWSLMFACPADLEAEADRLFAAHAEWMQRTHHREGEKALLQYTVTKGPHPEREDAVVYAMTEIYQSPAGVEDHSKQAHETFEDLPAFHTLLGQSEGPWGINGTILHSLW